MAECEHLEDPVELLIEWYTQWADSEEMPNKMGDALHVRTAMYLLLSGRLSLEEIARETLR